MGSCLAYVAGKQRATSGRHGSQSTTRHWSVITVLWAMNKHEPVSYAHVDLGSWILILEEVAEAQEGQPWGSGSVQLVGRSVPGELWGAADGQQRHSTDAGGDRKDREGPHLQLWSETPVRWVWGSRPDGRDRRNRQTSQKKIQVKVRGAETQETGATSPDRQHISGIQTDTSHVHRPNRRSLVAVPGHVITIPVIPNGLSPAYPEMCKSSNGWLDKTRYTGSGLEGWQLNFSLKKKKKEWTIL